MYSFTVSQFQIQKAGNSFIECEDAIATDSDNLLFAIADGVSDSVFQSQWAKLLVEGFINQPPSSFSHPALRRWFTDWLRTSQSIWFKNIDWENVPYHGVVKASQKGGQATFLGIRFSVEKSKWDGIVVGDCNLFQFRKNGTVYSFPIRKSNQFPISPAALSSINPNFDVAWNHLRKMSGRYEQGDTILLTTDALAAWLISEVESRKRPLVSLLKLKTKAEFEFLIDGLRQDKKIMNDDTSLIIIRTGESLTNSEQAK